MYFRANIFAEYSIFSLVIASTTVFFRGVIVTHSTPVHCSGCTYQTILFALFHRTLQEQ